MGRDVHGPSRRAALALIAAIGLACGDGTRPPPDEVCPTATVPLCDASKAGAVVAARDAVSDAASRLAPALENASARGALGTRLSELDAAVAAGNVTRAREALRLGREALASGVAQLGTFPGDAADLTFIELALDQVDPLLRAP